jgi:hypothetical protein
MAARKTPTEIKAYFQTGDVPTQAQFEEFIDNSVPTCKRYKALLTQTGTNAPVATVLENTLGNLVWARSSSGIYTATLTGAFPLLKTFAPIILDHDIEGAVFGQHISIRRSTDDYMTVKTIDTASSVHDSYLNYTPILIEVYD